jgi:putative acetyltransferase
MQTRSSDQQQAVISFKRTGSANTDFRDLVVLLDRELAARDGEEHAFYARFNKLDNIGHVVVCYVNDLPAGCGAFKAYDETRVEIKRMFVQPEYRGHGIGHGILKALESWAATLHYSGCILETGKKQPEAIRLYEKAGYNLVKNYGQYKEVENSVCMEKSIL